MAECTDAWHQSASKTYQAMGCPSCRARDNAEAEARIAKAQAHIESLGYVITASRYERFGRSAGFRLFVDTGRDVTSLMVDKSRQTIMANEEPLMGIGCSLATAWEDAANAARDEVSKEATS